METWKELSIAGFRPLMVSSAGRVKTPSSAKHPSGVITHGTRARSGYMVLSVYNEGQRALLKVHRLVAMAFIDNPLANPQVNHINGDKGDNRVANLEWCSASHNTHHAIASSLRNTSGDNNWTRKHPERLKRGADSWSANNKHRLARGESHGNSKLTEQAVREILELCGSGIKQKDIASAYGISRQTLHRLRAGESWAHLSQERT